MGLLSPKLRFSIIWGIELGITFCSASDAIQDTRTAQNVAWWISMVHKLERLQPKGACPWMDTNVSHFLKCTQLRWKGHATSCAPEARGEKRGGGGARRMRAPGGKTLLRVPKKSTAGGNKTKNGISMWLKKVNGNVFWTIPYTEQQLATPPPSRIFR